MGLTDIPSYDRTGGIIAFILALILGGLGILIWGLIKSEKNTMIQGAILLVLMVVGYLIFSLAGLVGWVLGLIWAIMVLIRSW